MTDCPTLSFLTALAAQSPVQTKIVTCHGKDIPTPYGQAYRTKNSCLRISDPRFGPAVGLAVCPRWLAGMTIASQLRRPSLRIGLLGK